MAQTRNLSKNMDPSVKFKVGCEESESFLNVQKVENILNSLHAVLFDLSWQRAVSSLPDDLLNNNLAELREVVSQSIGHRESLKRQFGSASPVLSHRPYRGGTSELRHLIDVLRAYRL